jgi:protein-tyrosine-phosphatase
MTEGTYNVAILCTGNSARSILAEGILRQDGRGRFRAYSAGSQPKGTLNPLGLRVLGAHGYSADGSRPKAWDEFAAQGEAELVCAEGRRTELLIPALTCPQMEAVTCQVGKAGATANFLSV